MCSIERKHVIVCCAIFYFGVIIVYFDGHFILIFTTASLVFY